LKPIPGHTIIHVLAVGDEETFGPNRNGDAFSRKDNKTAHKSFKEVGSVYRGHDHDDPLKSVGDVIATAHNSLMSRIELMLSLDNKKCEKELDNLSNGKDIPTSMGSLQAYDICNICENKAETKDEHCNHIKKKLGMVLSDGRKVYMKNPNPKYFDISLVFKPADRIAYTLRKVAAESGNAEMVIGGHDLAEALGIRGFGSPKMAALKSLASIYKTIPLSIRQAAKPGKLKPSSVQELKKKACIHGLDQLLGFLHSNNWLLSSKDFAEVIGHKDPEVAEVADEAYEGLEQLLGDDTDVDAFGPPCCQEHIGLSQDTLSDLTAMTSMEPEPVRNRVIKITIIKKAAHKPVVITPEIEGLSLLYKNYKLAYAVEVQDRPEVLAGVAATF
jgi:hypothetical protein